MSDTYTNRHTSLLTVKEIAPPQEDGSAAVTADDGWTAFAPAEVVALLHVGKEYVLETVNFSRITGWMVEGVWVARKSDADLEREHQEFREDLARRHREELEANREQWQARQDALPEWVRERMETFHAKAGENFALEGWGYELIVAELAVLYLASEGQDDDTINEFAQAQGTSGNQHDMAKALAQAHRKGASLAGTVSALSPITGSPFYETEVTP